MKNNFLKNFIKKLFNKNKLIEEHNENMTSTSEKFQKDTLKKQITVEGIEEKNRELYQKMKEEKNIDYVIDIVNKNPDVLENLSISKLEKINQFYDKRIEEMEIKINKLKKANN